LSQWLGGDGPISEQMYPVFKAGRWHANGPNTYDYIKQAEARYSVSLTSSRGFAPARWWDTRDCRQCDKKRAMKEPHWMELWQQASVEQDPEKLMELITEISRLLDEKETLLRQGTRRRKTLRSYEGKWMSLGL
jgi:hypothetical protein